jgi:hypothetical protein
MEDAGQHVGLTSAYQSKLITTAIAGANYYEAATFGE